MRLPRTSLAALLSFAMPLAAQFEEGHVRVLLDVTGGTGGDLFGWTAVALGDVNGDLVTDFAVSLPFDDQSFSVQSSGTVLCVSGASGATLWSRSESLTSSILGFALERMDWNADGVLDAVASAPFNSTGGRVWVFSGLDGATLATLDLSATNDGFGASLATGGDFDGDGVEDLAIGAPYVDTGLGSEVGRVYVYARGAAAPFTTMDGPAALSEFGLGLSFLGDISVPSDGRDELVVGNRLAASFYDGEARVIALVGSTPTELYSVGGVGMGPDLISDRIDAGLDVDGDGFPDFLVGDLRFSKVDVFSGGSGAFLYTLVGDADDAAFGTGHLVPDMNHDGRADLAIGAWPSDVGASDSGKVFVYSGASGTVLKTITPTDVDRGLGCEVRGIDDFDGDGRADLLVGAYGNGGVGLPRGRMYVFSGHLPAPNNVPAPAELAGDPILLDNGGDPASGPLIASAFEPFNVTLDCAGHPSGSPYLLQGRDERLTTPSTTPYGRLWMSGARLFLFTGTHVGSVLEAVPGGLVLPPDLALVGLDYTVQGWCGGGGARLSNALTQTIGR